MPEDKKFDPFQLAKPSIPGVSGQAAPPEEPAPAEEAGAVQEAQPAPRREIPWKWIALGGVALVVVAGLAAFISIMPSGEVEVTPLEQSAPEAAPAADAGAPSASPAASSASTPLPVAPREDVATVEEMAKPWSSKRFLFRTALGETVPAMLVRLPGGSARSPSGYWAFSLKAPFGKCDLELVSDVKRLREEFNVGATHPMVVDSCTGVVYNPLGFGSVSGALVRGQLVRGRGYRPPVMIEVRVTGKAVQATQIEQ
jgi:hypothetical protein